MYGNGRCAQPNDQDDGRCWAFEDRYGTDRCTAVAIVRKRVVGTWFTGMNPGGWDVVYCFASRDGYGANPCTAMAIAPNRVVKTTVAVGRWETGTVLIVLQY